MFLILLLYGSAIAQEMVPNDACANARRMEIGEEIHHLDNQFATLGTPGETPREVPYTCIRSFENDQWFSFTSQPEYDYYEVTIVPGTCNTPAGLQALIIQASHCDASKYIYRSCANPETIDTLKLFLREEEPNQQFFIYVDGFDGTVCDFSISLKGEIRKEFSRAEYRYTQYEYDDPNADLFDPAGVRTRFENNAVTLEWSARNINEVSFFAVEQVPPMRQVGGPPSMAKVMGIVETKHFTGSNGTNWFEFTDYYTIYENKDYCYRIVAVGPDGSRSISKPLCIKADVVETFFVDDIRPGPESGMYEARYISYQKQDFQLSVLNSEQKEVKHHQMKKEPARDGTVTIDMREFDPGIYYFKMSNGEEYFLRKFIVQK